MNPRAPIHVDKLEIDMLPIGRASHVWVELVTDGLAQVIEVPLLVVRGKRPGPVVGITAAVHGNELNGISVIHRLFETLPSRMISGTVVGVVVANVPGLHHHQREFDDGVDLNDIFPGNRAGSASQVYAYQLVERIIRQFDYLLDLHTASFGRVNSLYVRADMTHSETASMARLQNPQIILHNPPSDGTLRGAAMELGIPAITVEIADPHRFQPKYIRPTLAGVHAVLAHHGLIKPRAVKQESNPVVCDRSFWMYTDRGGLLNVHVDLASVVKKGDSVAVLRNAFGEVIAEYQAPESGVVIGKSVNPVAQTGARVVHLGLFDQAGKPSRAPRSLDRPKKKTT